MRFARLVAAGWNKMCSQWLACQEGLMSNQLLVTLQGYHLLLQVSSGGSFLGYHAVWTIESSTPWAQQQPLVRISSWQRWKEQGLGPIIHQGSQTVASRHSHRNCTKK